MCNCASCSYTDEFAGKGFAAWPRGEAAGPRASAHAYALHVAHSFYGAKKRATIGPSGAGFYGTPAGMTRGQVEEALRRSFAEAEKQSPAEAGPARPETPCKAPQHFPAPDRRRQTATIYSMPKNQPKRPRGRPALPGRRVVVKLEERHVKRARELGGDNIAEGIRKALTRQSSG